MKTTRRDFLKSGAAAGLAAAVPASAQSAGALTEFPTPPTVRRGDMVYRALGSTGEQVSLIGLGGYHIGVPDTDAEGIRLIHAAVDRGINFLDNCWDYNGGNSEVRMGKALAQGGYRRKVFLMTKIDGRTHAAATQQLDESLRRLQTDHLDLLQFHEILRMEDPDRVFAKGGALDVALAARRAGKVRHIGFTGHKDPHVHLRMLEVADRHGFHFDTVQMPLNVMDAHFRSFREGVIPVALKKKIGVLGMKPFGGGALAGYVQGSKIAAPIDLLHYAMSLPTSVVITGMDRMERLDQALEAARTWRPMPPAQRTALLSRTRDAAATGQYERFKTSTDFDGTAHNPQWLG